MTKNISEFNIKMFFRNAWLISMLVFVIFVVLNFLSNFLFKFNIFNAITSVIFLSVIIIGVLSFLGWVFLLLFSNKILRIVASIMLLASVFYTFGLYTIFEIASNLRNYEQLQEEYSYNYNLLPEKGGDVCGNDIQKELGTYYVLDSISNKMKSNLYETEKNINIAQKIVIPKKYRVTVLNKLIEIYENQKATFAQNDSPVYLIDSIAIKYWCNSYIELGLAINNLGKDYDNNDYSNMQKYLEIIQKGNNSKQQYLKHYEPVMKDVYELLPNHKYNVMEWEKHETEFYLIWEKLNIAMINKNTKDINYYYNLITTELKWFDNNPSIKYTSEVAEGLAIPRVNKINKLIEERNNLWREFGELKISMFGFLNL